MEDPRFKVFETPLEYTRWALESPDRLATDYKGKVYYFKINEVDQSLMSMKDGDHSGPQLYKVCEYDCPLYSYVDEFGAIKRPSTARSKIEKSLSNLTHHNPANKQLVSDLAEVLVDVMIELADNRISLATITSNGIKIDGRELDGSIIAGLKIVPCEEK